MYKNEMKKEIVFFMPSFEGGGVEKNIRMIANYFASKNVKISLYPPRFILPIIS